MVGKVAIGEIEDTKTKLRHMELGCLEEEEPTFVMLRNVTERPAWFPRYPDEPKASLDIGVAQRGEVAHESVDRRDCCLSGSGIGCRGAGASVR
jgi:hypothetical protein